MQILVKPQKLFPYSALFPPLPCKYFTLCVNNKTILVEPFANSNYNFMIGQNLANMLNIDFDGKKSVECTINKYNNDIADARMVYMKISSIFDLKMEMFQIRYVNINASTKDWCILRIEEVSKNNEEDIEYYKSMYAKVKDVKDKKLCRRKKRVKGCKKIRKQNDSKLNTKDAGTLQNKIKIHNADFDPEVTGNIQSENDTKYNDNVTLSTAELLLDKNTLENGTNDDKNTAKDFYCDFITQSRLDKESNAVSSSNKHVFYRITSNTRVLYTNLDNSSIFGYSKTEESIKSKININMKYQNVLTNSNLTASKFLVLYGPKCLKRKEVCQKIAFELQINHLHIDCKNDIDMLKAALDCKEDIVFTIENFVNEINNTKRFIEFLEDLVQKKLNFYFIFFCDNIEDAQKLGADFVSVDTMEVEMPKIDKEGKLLRFLLNCANSDVSECELNKINRICTGFDITVVEQVIKEALEIVISKNENSLVIKYSEIMYVLKKKKLVKNNILHDALDKCADLIRKIL